MCRALQICPLHAKFRWPLASLTFAAELPVGMLYTRQHALLLGVAGALAAALSLTVCRPHPWPYALHTDLVTRHSIGSTCDRDVALQRKDRRISLTRSRHAKLRGEWRFDPHTTCFHAGPDERRQIGRLGPEQARRRYVVASLQRSGSPSSVCRSFYEQTTLEAFNIIPDWATNNTFIAKASLGRPCAAVHARERSGVAAGICDDCGGFHPRHVSAHSGRERGRASAHHRDWRRPRQARCTCAAAHELPLTQLVPRGTLRVNCALSLFTTADRSTSACAASQLRFLARIVEMDDTIGDASWRPNVSNRRIPSA